MSQPPIDETHTKMRLALITETFAPDVNGVSMTLGHWCQELLALGARIDLVVPGKASDSQTGLHRWQASGSPIPGYSALRFGWKLPTAVKRHWRQQPPDIFYIATEGPLGLSALNYARRHRIPVISGFHTNFDQYLRHYRLGSLQGLLRRYLRWFHNRTEHTLVPSEQQRTALLDQGYQRVSLVGRGVDTQLFTPVRRSNQLRSTLGVTEDQLLLGYVGRLAGEKNLPLLLAAWQQLRNQYPQLRLLLVGDGPLYTRIARQHPDILLAGAQRGEQLAAHYACMDLFLFPSHTETYGNVIAEALASGVPVIAFNRAAARELIRPRHNGLVIDEHLADPLPAFVEATRQLIENTDLRQQLQHNAHQDMHQRSWQQIGQQLHQLMQQTLNADQA